MISGPTRYEARRAKQQGLAWLYGYTGRAGQVPSYVFRPRKGRDAADARAAEIAKLVERHPQRPGLLIVTKKGLHSLRKFPLSRSPAAPERNAAAGEEERDG